MCIYLCVSISLQLYNAFSSTQAQLQLEQQESRRISRVLDEIVQEVESKAPVLRRQREEYEALQSSMASLCNKLELARDVRSSHRMNRRLDGYHSPPWEEL